MKNIDKNEKELLGSFENEEWVSVPNISDRKAELKDYAHATIRKD